jgi:LacI family transcriptional regulator
MHAIHERHLRIPEDISVASFDDIDPASYLNPALTTVKIYAEDMGRTAVRVLFERLQEPDRPPQHLLITGQFIPRSSIGPAKTTGKGGD